MSDRTSFAAAFADRPWPDALPSVGVPFVRWETEDVEGATLFRFATAGGDVADAEWTDWGWRWLTIERA